MDNLTPTKQKNGLRNSYVIRNSLTWNVLR